MARNSKGSTVIKKKSTRTMRSSHELFPSSGYDVCSEVIFTGTVETPHSKNSVIAPPRPLFTRARVSAIRLVRYKLRCCRQTLEISQLPRIRVISLHLNTTLRSFKAFWRSNNTTTALVSPQNRYCSLRFRLPLFRACFLTILASRCHPVNHQTSKFRHLHLQRPLF